jgi:hypothetical protein
MFKSLSLSYRELVEWRKRNERKLFYALVILHAPALFFLAYQQQSLDQMMAALEKPIADPVAQTSLVKVTGPKRGIAQSPRERTAKAQRTNKEAGMAILPPVSE